MWGGVPEPLTAVQDVLAVPPGGWLAWVRDEAPASGSWASVAARWAKAAREPSGAPFGDAVRESVQRHLVSDVEVGLFLSSGVDSIAVLNLARELGTSAPRCITLGFSEFEGRAADEVPLARRAAEEAGAVHEVRRISRQEFEEDLPKILHAMDQPSIDGVNSWFVSKAAHEAGLKVALSGLGGDELLGGYDSFRTVPRIHGFAGPLARLPGLPALFAGALRVAAALPVLGGRLPPKLPGLLRHARTFAGCYRLRRGLHLPEELPDLLGPSAAGDACERLEAAVSPEHVLEDDFGDSDFARVAALESCLYMRNQLLRDLDWAGMAHSLEVRVPLVDWRLLDAVSGAIVARPQGKAPLIQTAHVPDSVAARAKTGFTIPVPQWISAHLAGLGLQAEAGNYRAWARFVWDRWFEQP